MTFDFPRSISDGYSEYVGDEVGYNYHAWEVISASESRRHEQIQFAEPGDLDQLRDELAPLSDLERWAMGRRFLKVDDRANYFAHVEKILDGDHSHQALHYPEIFVDVARRRAETDDDLGPARQLLGRIEDKWPEVAGALPLLEAQLLLLAQRIEEANEAFADALKPHEDVDLLLETAEDFYTAGVIEIAKDWLQLARETALQQSDRASMVDIELLSRALEESDGDDQGTPAESEQ